MRLSEVRVSLCANGNGNGSTGRLKAFCSLTFDNMFVLRDVKLIDGNDGLFLAMPSRKLCDHCPKCREKNHLRARFCNNCGNRLDGDRYLRYRPAGNPGSASSTRVKLHADIAHPISADGRRQIEETVLRAYQQELERSRMPGYVAASMDGDLDLVDEHVA
jgi:stage V sporulation protein G